MTRDNKKWKTNIPLFDYDAVSLYPSAMNRLYCIKGKPEILNPHELNLKYLLEHTAAENKAKSLNYDLVLPKDIVFWGGEDITSEVEKEIN